MTPSELAKRITKDLFVNGIGEKAARLVLVDESGFNLGGWSKTAVESRIIRVLTDKPQIKRRKL